MTTAFIARGLSNSTSRTKSTLPLSNNTATCHDFSARTESVNLGSVGVSYGFFSPNHPQPYTNNVECIRLIEAPVLHFIVLDFRDSFSIEHSSRHGCEYDFLEVRDGPFGFSPLIGKFCGQSAPKTIVSRTRYLWLRFVADQAIEHEGFHIVYRFVNYSGKNSPSRSDWDVFCPRKLRFETWALKSHLHN